LTPMDALELGAGLVIAFAMTLILIPWLIPKLRAKGIVGRDLNKPNKPEVAEMGGIAAVIGFFAGVSLLLAIDGIEDREILYVSLSTVLGAAFIGVLDDIFELRHRQKAFFPFLLALPLGAALDPVVNLPLIGVLDLGPLMILAAPFAITCAANAGNMLEGFNGLGAGLGIIMSSTLILLAVGHSRMDGVYLLVPLLGGLAAFIIFNKFPAKVFPGDTLMLFMGAVIATAGMLSNLYFQTVIIFTPMIAEFFLKLRGRFKAENYCSNSDNGHLEYNGRIESLTHVFMRRLRLTEQNLVLIFWGIEAVLCGVVVAVDMAI
jgi:UDP-N-acetylglucosamine--dolichyl-phosphate N-acetylglucosaminephosphotransferase